MRNYSPRLLHCAMLVISLTFSFNVIAKNTDYSATVSFDLTQWLAPAPTENSFIEKQDLDAVILAQKTNSVDRIELAKSDSALSVFRFINALKNNIDVKQLSKTVLFFEKMKNSFLPSIETSKTFWNRPRPYVVSDEVIPIIKKLKNPSYPSGHATLGQMYAILLSQMVPEQKALLFNRAYEYGQSRIIAGVHFPTDVEAGRIAGTLLTAKIMEDKELQAEFEGACEELRKELKIRNNQKVACRYHNF